jgi:hypothetical protein
VLYGVSYFLGWPIENGKGIDAVAIPLDCAFVPTKVAKKSIRHLFWLCGTKATARRTLKVQSLEADCEFPSVCLSVCHASTPPPVRIHSHRPTDITGTRLRMEPTGRFSNKLGVRILSTTDRERYTSRTVRNRASVKDPMLTSWRHRMWRYILFV